MMRSQRRASPLFALIGFEIAAIAVLSWVGSSPAMQVPWHDFGNWIKTASLDELAMPLIRYAALGLAYWMLASTLLFIAAQFSRNASAMRVAGMFTLPSVRRAVDGAMAVSIATTSMVGFAAGAVGYDSIQGNGPSSINTLVVDLTASEGAADVVTTPTDLSTTSTVPDATTTTEAPTTTSTEAPSTTSTSTPETPSNLAAAPTDQQATTSLAPSSGDDFVPTPRPGAPAPTTPQAPADPAPATPETPPPAQEGTHKVVPGDNLWTIARDTLAKASNRDKGAISEAEIRTYWLKVIEANKGNIRSGDPHWIFPGEVINLPPVSTPTSS